MGALLGGPPASQASPSVPLFSPLLIGAIEFGAQVAGAPHRMVAQAQCTPAAPLTSLRSSPGPAITKGTAFVAGLALSLLLSSVLGPAHQQNRPLPWLPMQHWQPLSLRHQLPWSSALCQVSAVCIGEIGMGVAVLWLLLTWLSFPSSPRHGCCDSARPGPGSSDPAAACRLRGLDPLLVPRGIP